VYKKKPKNGGAKRSLTGEEPGPSGAYRADGGLGRKDVCSRKGRGPRSMLARRAQGSYNCDQKKKGVLPTKSVLKEAVIGNKVGGIDRVEFPVGVPERMQGTPGDEKTPENRERTTITKSAIHLSIFSNPTNPKGEPKRRTLKLLSLISRKGVKLCINNRVPKKSGDLGGERRGCLEAEVLAGAGS